jgi:hypothetical protein
VLRREVPLLPTFERKSLSFKRARRDLPADDFHSTS